MVRGLLVRAMGWHAGSAAGPPPCQHRRAGGGRSTTSLLPPVMTLGMRHFMPPAENHRANKLKLQNSTRQPTEPAGEQIGGTLYFRSAANTLCNKT